VTAENFILSVLTGLTSFVEQNVTVFITGYLTILEIVEIYWEFAKFPRN